MLSLGNPRCQGQETSLLLVSDTTLCVVLSAALSLTLLATLRSAYCSPIGCGGLQATCPHSVFACLRVSEEPAVKTAIF